MVKEKTKENQPAAQPSQPSAPVQPEQPQQKPGTGKGILIGCIIGCVVLVIIGIILLFVGCGVFKWGTGYNWPSAPSSFDNSSQSEMDRAAEEAIRNAQ